MSTTPADASESTERAPVSVPHWSSLVGTVIRRELRTVVATPTGVLLGLVTTAIILAIAVVGGGYTAGYIATTVDLLVPLQLLIPVLAVALGYNAVLGDARRGELDVLETYPIRPWQLVGGIYLGRVIGLFVVLAVPLLLVLGLTTVGGTPRLPMYASHTGADSPGLYLRMVVLTLVFAAVMLAVAVAISALVSSARTALVGGGLVVLLLVFGLDLAIAQGFSLGVLGEWGLLKSLALSPLSAYRGLVLETAVVASAGTGPATAAPLASAIGLLVWGVGSLLVAARAVAR